MLLPLMLSLDWAASATPVLTQDQSTTGPGQPLIIKSQASRTVHGEIGGNIDLVLGASDGLGNVHGVVNIQLDGYAGNLMGFGFANVGHPAAVLDRKSTRLN